jgi:hypothetical protein
MPDYEMIKKTLRINGLPRYEIRDQTKRGKCQHGEKKIAAEALVSLLQEGRRKGIFAVQTKLIHNTFF